ncbi:MAG: glycosyltransferase [Alistipes sp.]|nr:glycosyltransferase [Alistipes sp.]
MKIMLVITRSELGGAQSVVVQLANYLSACHDVVLVAGEGDGKMWDMVSERVTREHCPHLQRSISLKSDILAIRELHKIYKRHKPDVVHLHSSKAGTLGRLGFPRKRTVYTVHGFDSVRVAFRKFLPVERALQHLCSAIVAVSNYDKENLIAEGIKHNVSTAYNGISRPETANLQDIAELSRYDKVVLSIARVSDPKRPDLFIDVARRLPQYGFVWIGNLEEVTEYGPLPENCHFVGNIPNAGAYCSQADLFMLASNYEGLPMVILEAMSFGKPVVASNVGGVSEIVRDGVNGYVLPNDADLFATKIEEILEDSEIYKHLSHSSLEIFEKELTVDRMVDGYMSVYNRIISQN